MVGTAFSRSALHITVEHLHVPIIEYLVAMGADLEIKDNYGNTPLNVASGSDTSPNYLPDAARLAVMKTVVSILVSAVQTE